jgi:predicted CopG family antitoxin
MASSAKRMRQIVIDELNYKSLQMLDHVPESFNDVLTRILEENRNPWVIPMSRIPRTGSSGEFVPITDSISPMFGSSGGAKTKLGVGPVALKEPLPTNLLHSSIC